MSMRHLRTVISVTEKFMRDTESVRNDSNDGDGLDPANEYVISISRNSCLIIPRVVSLV